MIFADKHSARDKRLLRLERELNRLWQAHRDAPIIPLERPYQRGWYKTFRLRDDAWHHPETLVFQGVLPVINQVVRCARRDFVSRNGHAVVLSPKIIGVDAWKRLAWPIRYQRLFAYGAWPVEEIYPWTWIHHRRCVRGFRLMRPWWLDEQVEPLMITHQRVDLPEVRSRIAEIENYFRHGRGRGRLHNLHGVRAYWREYRDNDYHNHRTHPAYDWPQPD
jgi:hypothetical protein